MILDKHNLIKQTKRNLQKIFINFYVHKDMRIKVRIQILNYFSLINGYLIFAFLKIILFNFRYIIELS